MTYAYAFPPPLLSTRRKVAVSWSPKAGCSHVLVWFLVQENLLQKAEKFHYWPHEFRERVLEKSQARQDRVQQLLTEGPGDWTLIKVTRDPFKRMIASFRHVVRHPLIDEVVAKRLGIDIARDGLSLRDFVAALSGLPLEYGQGLNNHVCKQEQPIWHQHFKTIITINIDEIELNAALNAAARDTGLDAIDFGSIEKFAWLRSVHHAADVSLDRGDIVDFRFKRGAWPDRFPKTALLASPEAAGFARRLYHTDYSQVMTRASA